MAKKYINNNAVNPEVDDYGFTTYASPKYFGIDPTNLPKQKVAELDEYHNYQTEFKTPKIAESKESNAIPIESGLKIPGLMYTETSATDGTFGKPVKAVKAGSIDSGRAIRLGRKLMAAGISKEHTAAILGNLQQESSLIADRNQDGKNKDGSYGYGMAQWTVGRSRYKNLERTAVSMGKSIKDEDVQVQHLLNELKDPSVWSKKAKPQDFFSAKNVSDATLAFSKGYENPADWAAANNTRIANANYIYKLL